MEQTSTVVEQPQAPPAAEPAQPDHGWPKEALVSEKEGYDHRDPAKKAEQTSIDAKKYLEATRREELAKQKAEREARLDPDRRVEQFQKQNEEALRQSVRSRREVQEAISQAADGEDLWKAIAEHPSLVKDFEDATPEQVQRLLDATREELNKAGRTHYKANAETPEEILTTARTHGEHVEQETKALLDAFAGNKAELRGLETTLALAQHARDFPEIVKKLSEPFFSDAATTREGAQRTKELQADLAEMTNAPKVHLALLRIPDAAKQMALMPREERRQVVLDLSVALKLNEARAVHADFDKVVLPFVQHTAHTHPTVAEAIGRSPHMGRVLYLIGRDATESARFLNLARTDPLGAVRLLTLYDHYISAGEKGNMPTVQEAGPVPLRKPSPPPKTMTTAPPPPTEIGGKTQRAPDALDRALKDGDVQAYARELRRQAREGRG